PRGPGAAGGVAGPSRGRCEPGRRGPEPSRDGGGAAMTWSGTSLLGRTSIALLLLLLASCTPPPAAAPPPAVIEQYDEQALIEAAKNEPPLAALNNSGIVKTLAENFEKKYGLKVNGNKADSPTQVEQVTREVQSGNVQLGVLSIEDGALVQGLLIPQGIVDNWVPPDMVDTIPTEWQNPMVQLWDAKIVDYNPDVY